MPVPKKLINYLEREKVTYELVHHRIVYTAWDLSQTLRVKPSQIVKTLVVKLRGKVPTLILIPAQKNLDKKKLGNVVYNEVQKLRKIIILDQEKRGIGSRVSAKGSYRRSGSRMTIVPLEWNFPPPDLKGKSYSVEFAKEKWMKEKLLGKIGATPPFGRLLRLPMFIDKSLLKEKELILNSGNYKIAISIKTKDFIKLETPLSGNFSIKK